MPFITAPLNDIHEPKAASEGEYDLRIVKAVRAPSKKGRDMITATIIFEDPTVDAPPFGYWLLNPDDEDDDNQRRMRALEAKRFMACFGLPDDFDEDDLVGATGRSYVAQRVGDDDVVRNELRLPRLKE